ncbi:hypothetical protein B0H11DRAFT_1908783 [Mycena galericulata]|nr:hypothetical protein B0H11DRAFT_1908783 [Mycena galericulata]
MRTTWEEARDGVREAGGTRWGVREGMGAGVEAGQAVQREGVKGVCSFQRRVCGKAGANSAVSVAGAGTGGGLSGMAGRRVQARGWWRAKRYGGLAKRYAKRCGRRAWRGRRVGEGVGEQCEGCGVPGAGAGEGGGPSGTGAGKERRPGIRAQPRPCAKRPSGTQELPKRDLRRGGSRSDLAVVILRGAGSGIKIIVEFSSGIKIIVEFSVCEDGMKEKAEDIVGRKEHDLAGGFPNAKFAQTRTAVPFADIVTPCSHVRRDCGMGREINSREGAARYLSAWQSDRDVEDTEGTTSQMDMLRRVCSGL